MIFESLLIIVSISCLEGHSDKTDISAPPPHIAAERPRRASAMTAFVRADLKRQGIFPSPDTSEEPEPKRIKLETTDAQSKCPFIKCEGD